MLQSEDKRNLLEIGAEDFFFFDLAVKRGWRQVWVTKYYLHTYQGIRYGSSIATNRLLKMRDSRVMNTRMMEERKEIGDGGGGGALKASLAKTNVKV